MWLDLVIKEFWSQWRVDWLDAVMVYLTALGGTELLVIFALFFAVLLLLKQRTRQALLLVIAMLTATGAELGLKALVERQRPPDGLMMESTYSFPSGHAMMATVFYLLLWYWGRQFLSKKWQERLLLVVSLLMIVVVSLSRVYLSVHWLTDVLAGMILGGLWVWGTINLERWLVKKG